MTSHHPERDARLAYADSPVSPQTALAALATSAAADAARSGRQVEIDEVSGFLLSPGDGSARERVQLGGPRWLFPAVLGVIAAMVLATVGVYWWQDRGNHADRAVFANTRIALPSAAAGLSLGVGPGVQQVQAPVSAALAEVGVSDAVTGTYLDSSGTSTVLVAAGRRVTPPNQLVATAESIKTKVVAAATGAVSVGPTTLRRTPPGSLGGVMRCGPTTVAGVAATYCIAVDEGSVAQFLVANADERAAATTARSLRGAVVQR